MLLIQSIHSVHVLSHKYLAVWPFSQEVLWSLSFPGRSFGFVIHCSVREETNCHFIPLAPAHANTGTDWNKSSTFLSQSSDSPRFSNYSSSPRCQEYAVRDGNKVKVQHFRWARVALKLMWWQRSDITSTSTMVANLSPSGGISRRSWTHNSGTL